MVIAIILAVISLVLYLKKITVVGIILAGCCLISAFIFVAFSFTIAKTKGPEVIVTDDQNN